MVQRLILWWLFLNCITIVGQSTHHEEDRTLFHKKLAQLTAHQKNPNQFSVTEIGKLFIGTPYVEKTLEVGKSESLVINLRGLDCTTFVENVLALSLLLKEGQTEFEAFGKKLKTIRYRNGILEGYPSRLHYFTDWIRNNNEKGFVRDITMELGGEIHLKAINFMGTHRELYPHLADDNNYLKMVEIEDELAEEELCILPQESILQVEDQLENGDIIALATSIKGLDVTHTGFAIRQPNGRIHLLHASISGAVTITKEPLADYLKKIKNNIGIIVARPL